MKLNNYKIMFTVIGLIGVLLISSPAICSMLPFPTREQFSELYLLGPGQMLEDLPHNITEGQTYSFFVGVSNQLGSAAYYTIYVKFLNYSEVLPDYTSGMCSSSPPLYEYKFILPYNQSWSSEFKFEVDNVSIDANHVLIRYLSLNDEPIEVNKSTVRVSNDTSFPFRMVFELWLYDASTGSIEYNNRFVYLELSYQTKSST